MKTHHKYMDFKTKLSAAWAKNNSLLCVGLDPDTTKLPAGLGQFEFNKAIIDATADLVCAYKPNSAFYEARGAAGIEELKQTCDYLHEHHPDLPIILDFKRGDIGNTNRLYAEFAFDYLGADAITIQPYQGQQALQPFLDYKEKGIIILCRMSNPGAEEFQNLNVEGQPLYLKVAKNISQDWNANGNCHLVVGATNPEEIAAVRQAVGNEMVLLVPGVGAQSGDIEAAVRAGGKRLIINSSRDILYASAGEDFVTAARDRATATRDAINKYVGA
jgi:orotidine-5'-phosphate decarboxylase